ncbi:serine/threonine protein kinase [Streptomyces hygroscopicus]|uniref:serine/threonine-protein kinase n=1 Tax=Streptomyces hygroscopicus TaxID=1912 RepID=UPI002240D89B|nr:serine/threonine-protein kinase [Streptomyces hygroscopicus]MCW7944946.1 serine/threonine protein kinase [Streptomyces hygroscopicus]
MGTEGENVRVIAGRYRLEERIGRGGMGLVWRAADQLLGRQVAVKELVLDPSLSAEEARLQRERTLREARAVAQLRHPHIIVVHDVVEDDERPYIVMELIDGGSLAERIAGRGPVDAREAARIGIDLLGALRRAHGAGVLHRDLKPANVLMEAGTDRVVLTDFGIAQVAGATTLTESGSFVGSPEYTAPERMSGERTGPESDLWSLGALLCAVLSGESPFRRDSLGGILHAVVVDEIRPPVQAQPILPVVRGLLERDPERRLDAAEAERLLREFLDTGRTPRAPVAYTPTQRDVPRRAVPPPEVPEAPTPPAALASRSSRHSARGVLIAAALVAAMAGAGVSAAALLMREGGNGSRTPASSGPSSPSASPSRPSAPGATVTVTRPPTTVPASATSRTVPSGYRLTHDPDRFSLAVPDGFTRSPQGERIFYMSPGETFRIGIKMSDPEPGGPLAVMRRSDADGPANNPGYHDGRVTETSHNGNPAALWEFTWNGFTAAEGPRHTYDLCWEEGDRMYDVWVSAPVGKEQESKEYFDVAVGTFVPG